MYAIFGILYRYESTGRRRTDMGQPGLGLQPLEDDALNKSARHGTLQQASLYYQNCLSQWEDSGFHRPQCWPEYKVSPWKSVFYSSGKFNRKNQNASTRTSLSITELADWYVRDALDCQSDYHWSEIYQLSLGKKGDETPFEQLRHLFHRFPDDQTRLEASRLFSECFKKSLDLEAAEAAEAVELQQQTRTNNGMALVTPEKVRGRDEEDDAERQRQKKKQRNLTREEQRAGPVEHQVALDDDRVELTGFDGSNEDVYEKMKEVVSKYKGKNKGFVPRDYQWLKRIRTSVGRVEKCIGECYNGDRVAFFGSMEKINRVSYKCICKR